MKSVKKKKRKTKIEKSKNKSKSKRWLKAKAERSLTTKFMNPDVKPGFPTRDPALLWVLFLLL
jgi:hypothetical protein